MPLSSNTIVRRRISMMLFIGSIATLCGCARSEVITELPPEQQNLRVIVMSYQQAVADHSHAPKSLEELRPYVAEYGDADTLLTSPNDGEPYTIVYDIDVEKLRRGQMPIVAYETTGSDGKHKAIDYQLIIRTLDDKQVAELTGAKR